MKNILYKRETYKAISKHDMFIPLDDDKGMADEVKSKCYISGFSANK